MYSISVFIQYLTKSKSHWKNMWSDLLLFHLVNPRSSTLSKDKRNIGKIVSISSLQSTEQKQRQNMFIVNLSIQRWKSSMFNYSKNNSFQENSISTFQSPQCQRINPYLNKKQFHVLYLSALVSKPPFVVMWVTSICSYIYFPLENSARTTGSSTPCGILWMCWPWLLGEKRLPKKWSTTETKEH